MNEFKPAKFYQAILNNAKGSQLLDWADQFTDIVTSHKSKPKISKLESQKNS